MEAAKKPQKLFTVCVFYYLRHCGEVVTSYALDFRLEFSVEYWKIGSSRHRLCIMLCCVLDSTLALSTQV